MDYNRILDLLVALTLFLIISGMVFVLTFNSAIETIKERINDLAIECTNTPTLNSIEITYNNEIIHCLVYEKSFQT